MNYKLSSQLREVYSFSVENKTLFTCSPKGCICDAENSLIYTCTGKFAPILKIITSTLCFYDEGQFLYDINKFSLKKFASEDYKQSSIDPHSSHFDIQTIIMLKDFDKKRFFGLFDVKNADLIWVKEYHISIINNINSINIFASTIPSNVLCFDKKNGLLLWQTDLSGHFYDFHGNRLEATILEILGVYEDILLVMLSNHCLVALSVATGEVLWEKIPYSDVPDMFGGVIGAVLEVQNHQIVWYNSFSYFVFNLQNKVGILLKSYPHTDKSQPPFTIKKSVFTEEYIYFIASQKSVILNNIVGVFNRKTLKIDWQEEVDILPKTNADPYNSFTDIQVGDNKIYVLNTEGTLWIFERENA